MKNPTFLKIRHTAAQGLPRRTTASVATIAACITVALVAGAAGLPFAPITSLADAATGSELLDVGGPLRPGLAAYDVLRYELDLRLDVDHQSVAGSVAFVLRVVTPIAEFECDLVDQLVLDSVRLGGNDGPELEHVHSGGRVLATLPQPWQVGETHRVVVTYHGQPVVAKKPKGFGGFVWTSTPESGRPWVGVSCQLEGADLWWPCKEHPSDKPDNGMSIRLTCPSDLVCLTNGRRLRKHDNPNGTTTSEWTVRYPINTYLVTVSAAPYVPLIEHYHGVDGDLDEELIFWALPEHRDQAAATWHQVPRMLEVLGRRFGEYPFFNDKLWFVETPYLGMEHQTLVAYGDHFATSELGFDPLLLHELAHEWWGNKISVRDWADFWIHESFATYCEALYVNDTQGLEAYLDYMHQLRAKVECQAPLVQGTDLPGSVAYTNDIYYKGAWMLHTLRYLIGDEAFFDTLKHLTTDPRHAYGFISTDDVLEAFAERSDIRLDWFWDRYLYGNDLPRWHLEKVREGERVRAIIRWDDPYFLMPVPVRIGEKISRIPIENHKASILIDPHSDLVVDPEGWILVEEEPVSDDSGDPGRHADDIGAEMDHG